MTTEATAATDTSVNTSISADATTAADQSTAAPATTEGTTTAATTAATTEGTTESTEATTTTTDKAAETEAEKPVLKAPDKYTLEAPEGTQLDPALVPTFEKLARDMDLSQDQAQAFIKEMVPEMVKAQAAALETLKTQWSVDSRSDKEFGGEKLGENLAVAKKALETFGTPELNQLLETSGLGNHPEIIRAFYRAGKQITSGSFVQGNQAPKSQANNAASKLYPDMTPGTSH